jgi:hypothetical protein
MKTRYFLTMLALAGAFGLAQPAVAQSADSASASADSTGGEGTGFPGYGRPGMAGNLPTSGYAYNDGSR